MIRSASISSTLEIGRASLPARPRREARLTVLDVTKWFGETSGGVKTYLREKSAYVRRRPHLRHVLVLPGAADEIGDDDGVRTYRLRGPRIPTQAQYRFLLATRSLRRIVEHERPDLIEVGSQLFVPWVARLATRRTRTPLIGFYHGVLERDVAALRPTGVGSGLVRAAARGYLRAVDRLFSARMAASDATARDLAAAGVKDITRVRLGVDLATFHPSRRANGELTRRQRGIPPGVRVVLYCGRLATEKEIAWVVNSWPRVQALCGAWLVIVGDGPLRQHLQRTAVASRSQIIWLNYEPDRERLADLMASADALVAPGPIETFGLAALEAMASGTPVLSVNAGAVPELVRRSGAGDTYRLRDEADFARTIARFLLDAPQRHGLRGRRYAEREHSWDCAFDEIFSIYSRLVAS